MGVLFDSIEKNILSSYFFHYASISFSFFLEVLAIPVSPLLVYFSFLSNLF